MSRIEDNPLGNIKSDSNFEDFCRDLLSRQPNLCNAQKLKKAGYGQYGGDITANVENSTNTIVAQCKHYLKTSFGKKAIEGVIELFLSHWDSFWKQKKVTEFYLMTSQSKTTDEQIETIQEQKEQLFKYGIKLIDWWQDDLVRESRKHSDLVRIYLGNYWLNEFFPEEFVKIIAPRSLSYFNETAFASVGLDTYKSTLSDALKQLMEPIREKVRCGKLSEAERSFHALKEKHFNLVKSDAQIEILSFEIRLFFPQIVSVAQANEILNLIKKINNDFNTNLLEALIASKEFGFEEGLEKLISIPDITTLNLKLSFLLNLNRFDEFLELYESEKENFEYELETKRLFSLYLASVKNIDDAISLIDEIAKEKPDWENVKISQAIIYYLNGISREFISDYPLNLPIPLPITSLKTDDESNNKRQIAANLFQEILNSETTDNEQKLILESWYLACLADNYKLQNEAIQYCKNILSVNPSHPYILLWTLNGNYEIDYSESFRSLENKFSKSDIEQNSININQCIMLITLCLKENQITKARRYLLVLKSLLPKEDEAELYNYWKCQIEIFSGNEEKVVSNYALQISNRRMAQDLQIIALQNLVRRNPERKNRRRLLKFLKKVSEKFNNIMHLPLYIEVCYQNKKFTEIVKHTERLSKFVKNINLAGILIESNYRVNQFKICLELIEKFKFIYPNGELPAYFQEYKAICLLKVGQLVEANEEADRLFDKEKSARTYQILFNIKKQTGDTYGIIQATSKIRSEIRSFEPEIKLLIAQTIYTHTPELAKEIWREAKQQVLQKNNVISDAINLGFQLGLDDELGEFFSVVNSLKNKELLGIQTYDIEETVEILNQQREKQQEIEGLYLKGQLPIHLLAEQVNRTLTEIYCYIPTLNYNEDNILRKRKIFIRNGNRFNYDNQNFLDTKKPILYLDISTLLLLEHLNLLEKVEESCVIYLSNKTFFTLETEITKLSDGQPKRNEESLKIIKLADDNLFSTIEITHQISSEEKEKHSKLLLGINEFDLATILQAEEQNALVIFELPLHNFKTNEEFLPSKIETIKDFSLLIKTLEKNSLLTVTESQKCNSAIKTLPNLDVIPLQSKIILTEPSLRKIESLGVLEKVCRHFQIYLDQRILGNIKLQVKLVKERGELQKWVANLESKIRSEYGKKYFFISEDEFNSIPLSNREKAEILHDYRFQNTSELLRLPQKTNSFASIEDRYFSGFSTINNQIPIITIFEILEKLLFEKLISEDEYYQKLHRLRTENFRYLPVSKEEIDYYLNFCDKEQLENSGTLELQKMRQYLADCFLNLDHYQIPTLPVPPRNPMMELEFIMGIKRVLSSYISHIWKEEHSFELAEAKSNFIFFNFYISTFVSRHLLPEFMEHKNGLFHQALDISDFYLQGLFLIKFNDNEVVKKYFSWVNSLFLTQLEKNPELLDETVKLICNLLIVPNNHIDPTKIEDKEIFLEATKITNKLYTNVIVLMPQILQEKILENDEIVKFLEIEPFSSISINNTSYLSKDFHEAVGNSIQSKETTIKPVNSDKSVIFFPITDSNNERIIKIKVDENQSLTLLDSEFGIYLLTAEERFEFLRSRKISFDCDEKLFLNECHRIAEIEDPAERYFAFKAIESGSMALAYQHLENQVVDSKSFNWKQVCNLPLQGLPKHFRLNIDNADEIKFPDFLENFTKQLLDEEGIETTLDRLSRLPYKFSEQIIEEFKLLSLDRKKELADRFRGDWRSPLGRLHYFMLVLSVFGNNDEFINKVREDVEFVFNSKEGKLEFEIFQVVLRLVYNEITSRTPSKTWSHEMKLILTWGHASKVFNLILLSEKDISEHEKLLNYIKNYINFCLHEIFDFNSILWTDCLHPRLFEGFTFYSFSTCSLFKDIPFELIEKTNLSKYLEPILFNQKDDVLYPQDLFLKVLNNRTNITSSILFSNKLEEYDWFCSGKTIVIIPSEAILDYFSSILEDLRKNYLDEEKWFYISFWLEDINLTDLFAKKYQLIIEAIDIEKIWEINPQLVQQILFFTTKQKEILSESLKQKVANWIKQITLKLAEKFPYHPTQSVAEEIDDWVFFISNTVIQWSIENNNPLISSLKYNDLIFELAYAWHYLPIRLENLFYRLWLNLPVEHNQNVGKNILLARALK